MDSLAKDIRLRRNFKVAIVGGGVCGLALFVALTKAGLDVDLYEAAVSVGVS